MIVENLLHSAAVCPEYKDYVRIGLSVGFSLYKSVTSIFNRSSVSFILDYRIHRAG